MRARFLQNRGKEIFLKRLKRLINYESGIVDRIIEFPSSQQDFWLPKTCRFQVDEKSCQLEQNPAKLSDF